MIDDLEITDYDELDNCTISFVSKQERAPVRIIDEGSGESDLGVDSVVGYSGKKLQTPKGEHRKQEVACFKSIADIVRLLPYVKKFKKVGLQAIQCSLLDH